MRLDELPLGVAAESTPADPGWLALDTRERGTRFISLPVRSVINPPISTQMPFWSINPYIGCEFGCAYCYARETHRWAVERAAARADASAATREVTTLPPAVAFERRILVKEGIADVLVRTLKPRRLNGDALVIGTATDPYQPAERRFGRTRSILEVLLAYRGLHLGIITKSPLIARDADLLAALTERHQLHVNISLASVDAALLRRLEPRTPAPHARLRAMRKLVDAGVHVGLLIAPVLPGLTDGRQALRALLVRARDAGAAWAGAGPLRMGPATRNTFLPWLAREYPVLATRYARHYGARRGVSRAYSHALEQRIGELRNELGLASRGAQMLRAGDQEKQLELL
ncbi:MAG TPA: radical SAM protein [Gemmatimonadales bacterium]|nr:radical SAM protein [Gemmatimonadales bacterium]